MEATTRQFRKRNAIYECLRGTTLHPSAEMVHEMLRAEHPDISLATVYRNLTYFKNRGMIISVATVDGTERFDANTDPHVHFICENCNAVIDLHEIRVPDALNLEVEENAGCRVDSCCLTFIGKCRECKSKTEIIKK